MTEEELIKIYADSVTMYLRSVEQSVAEKAARYAFEKAVTDFKKLTGKDIYDVYAISYPGNGDMKYLSYRKLCEKSHAP